MTDGGGTDDPELSTIAGMLEDDLVRSILAATSVEALSAEELGNRCEVSTSTIYRRLDDLERHGLVHERTRPRADGHHDSVYVALLEGFEVELRDGEFDWTVRRRGGDMADELTRMWEQL